MNEFYDADAERHDVERSKFLAIHLTVALEFVPETNTVYKVIARADRARLNQQVYLSSKTKSDLDRCFAAGMNCKLVVDGEEFVYRPDQNWTFLKGEGKTTPRWLALERELIDF